MVLEFRVLGILGILGFRVWGISRIWVQGSSDSRYPALVLLSGDSCSRRIRVNNRMRGVGCTGDNSCSLGFPLYSNDNNTNDKK